MDTFSIKEKNAFIDGKKIDFVTRVQLDLFPGQGVSLITLTTREGVISENVDSEISMNYDASICKRHRDWNAEREAEKKN